jgi:hypothetical protein
VITLASAASAGPREVREHSVQIGPRIERNDRHRRIVDRLGIGRHRECGAHLDARGAQIGGTTSAAAIRGLAQD